MGELDLVIRYKEDKSNVAADALSRLPQYHASNE